MNTVKKESTVFFDVDETLILHKPFKSVSGFPITVTDPLNPSQPGLKVEPHRAMIRLLKEEKHRGSFIVVWSRGGYEWATNVILALGLESSVDLVMTKPMVYFDDIPINEWLTNRVYIKPGTKYKE